jgi:hypothetical protein
MLSMDARQAKKLPPSKKRFNWFVIKNATNNLVLIIKACA